MLRADQPHPPFRRSRSVGGHPPRSPAPESPEDPLAAAAAAEQQTPPTRSAAAVTRTGGARRRGEAKRWKKMKLDGCLSLVWCVEQRNTGPDDIVAVDTPPEESE
ncbi:uncharacterized protein [Alexandromys fortis]|uniref:uncharacterized protein isoform X2 n=1 Tax=Alexandromys fortis TaxID=100897 RepID=UPI0021527C52|nr:uncharacterized protein LOC126507818 isoform X2 [Microtus fortis]